MKKYSTLVISLVLYLASTQAMELNPATIKAQVAGYKAAFTCSATFNGGKTPAMIKTDELTGIRLDYREYFAQLSDAVIHSREKYVSAKFSDDMPPRYAVWRSGLGCTQLPTGAKLEARKFVATANLLHPRTLDIKPWPLGDGLPAVLPANAALAAVVDAVFSSNKYGDPKVSSAILITTADTLLLERYKPGFTPFTSQRTWSTAKSIAATVIGVAVEQGLVDLKAPANIPEWSTPGDPRQQITLENLLHMASGLDSAKAGNRTSNVYYGGGVVTDNATERMLEAPPGKRWKYANNDTLLAIRSLRASINGDQKMLRFPFENLFWKIGMYNTVPETDWQGNFILSSQVWTTSRDLGRLGILYLNNGSWQGERLLPDDWREYVTTQAPAQRLHFQKHGKPLTGYGAQFWLYSNHFPGLPGDTFSTIGNRGQHMMIIPSRNIVIIRRGYDAAGGKRFDMSAFTADVLLAIPETL